MNRHHPSIPAPDDLDPWALLETLPVGVVVLDEGDLLRWCNRRAAAVLESDLAALVGAPAASILRWSAERGVVAERVADPTPLLVMHEDRSDEVARATFLADAGDQLAGSLNLQRTMWRIVDLAVPRLADACLLSVVDGREWRRVGAALRDGVGEQWQDAGPSAAGALDAAVGVHRADATLHREVTLERLAALVPGRARWPSLWESMPHTAMVVPVRARAAPVGALVLLGSEGRDAYGADDLALAEAFARRAAVALDNASLYRDRSAVAEVLQQTLLPPHLPRLPGIEIGAAYRPLVQTSDIGGDFYDVFQTAPDTWMVAVGDISGKGIAAAAVTGLARHTIRAAAMQVSEPSEILRALNDALRSDAGDRLCTVVLASVVPSSSGATLVVSSGGHPAPLLLRGDGEVIEADVQGTLLGAFPEVNLADVELRLEPGDALLLYTDGVTEARVGAEQFGDRRLDEVLGSSAGLQADTIAKRVMQEAVEFVGNGQTDDIAVVVLRVPRADDG